MSARFDDYGIPGLNGPFGGVLRGEGSALFGGLRVQVVPSWVPPLIEWRWVTLRPGRCPPRRFGPKGRRKGTRKVWKRAHPRGLRWRAVSIPQEPENVLRTKDCIYCTALQYRALKAKIAEAASPAERFDRTRDAT